MYTHASANGQSERKMRRWRKKEEEEKVNTRGEEEEEKKKTDEGGQAKETDGWKTRWETRRGRERERAGRTSRLATSKSHSEVPRAFEIFPLNELQAVADSSPAVQNEEDEDDERRDRHRYRWRLIKIQLDPPSAGHFHCARITEGQKIARDGLSNIELL